MAFLFVLVFAAIAVAALVNAVLRRPAANGGRIGGVLVLALMALRIGLALSDPDPRLGLSVGSVVGQALLPLLLCVGMDRRHAARLEERRKSAAALEGRPLAG